MIRLLGLFESEKINKKYGTANRKIIPSNLNKQLRAAQTAHPNKCDLLSVLLNCKIKYKDQR